MYSLSFNRAIQETDYSNFRNIWVSMVPRGTIEISGCPKDKLPLTLAGSASADLCWNNTSLLSHSNRVWYQCDQTPLEPRRLTLSTVLTRLVFLCLRNTSFLEPNLIFYITDNNNNKTQRTITEKQKQNPKLSSNIKSKYIVQYIVHFFLRKLYSILREDK